MPDTEKERQFLTKLREVQEDLVRELDALHEVVGSLHPPDIQAYFQEYPGQLRNILREQEDFLFEIRATKDWCANVRFHPDRSHVRD